MLIRRMVAVIGVVAGVAAVGVTLSATEMTMSATAPDDPTPTSSAQSDVQRIIEDPPWIAPHPVTGLRSEASSRDAAPDSPDAATPPDERAAARQHAYLPLTALAHELLGDRSAGGWLSSDNTIVIMAIGATDDDLAALQRAARDHERTRDFADDIVVRDAEFTTEELQATYQQVFDDRDAPAADGIHVVRASADVPSNRVTVWIDGDPADHRGAFEDRYGAVIDLRGGPPGDLSVTAALDDDRPDADERAAEAGTVAAIEFHDDPPAESLVLGCTQEGDSLLVDVRNDGDARAGVPVSALLVTDDDTVAALMVERSRALLPADEILIPARGAQPLEPGQGGTVEFPLPRGTEGLHRFVMRAPELMDTDDQEQRSASCDIDVELIEPA